MSPSSPASTLPFQQRSQWIWSSEGTHSQAAPEHRSPTHYQLRRFQLGFDLTGVADVSALAHVTADSRYLFYCNGNLLGRGPAKGDVNHHFYESYDLAPYLIEGRNVLSALVMDMSKVAHRPSELGAPCSVMTYAGGFLCEGTVATSSEEISLDTGDAPWRVAVDREHRFQNDGTRFEGYHGYFEARYDSVSTAVWFAQEQAGPDWHDATPLYLAERLENRRDPTSPYGLVPRMIPLLPEEDRVPFADGFHPGGEELSETWTQLLSPEASEVTIAPNSSVEVIWDTGVITTGYPVLSATGGRGAQVRLTYAEALRLPWDTPGAVLLGEQQPLENLASHFADEGTGWTFDRRGTIHGWSDVWRPAGPTCDYEPLHWRAFRYVGLTIETTDEPLTIHRVGYRYSAYPYAIKAHFSCDEPALERIWKAAVRTMQLCSHETFEDCPHYEQMQYAGDTMITSHLGMLTAGDYRLSRQSLYHFDWSRGPDGLTESRFPSRLRQVIPSWSLHWITTARDFGLCSGDLATVSDLMPGMLAVLDWFRRHCDERGLPAKLPYWNITDWCPWWPRGVVPGAADGPTCIISAQWIQGLDEVAEMAEWLGQEDRAKALRAEAEQARKTLHATFWSEEEGLYFDRPGGPEVSQYGNAWAVVCGAADERTCDRLRARFPHDASLAPGSFFCWHAVFTAMVKMGTYDQMEDCLGPWHESINLGLDTFVEENSYWRSLCHAWSAHPVLEFLQRMVGVKATRPGFSAVRIQPIPGRRQRASGRVCTPRGFIDVAWEKQGDEWAMRVDAPAETQIEIILPDGTTHRSMGGHWQRGQLSL